MYFIFKKYSMNMFVLISWWIYGLLFHDNLQKKKSWEIYLVIITKWALISNPKFMSISKGYLPHTSGTDKESIWW